MSDFDLRLTQFDLKQTQERLERAETIIQECIAAWDKWMPQMPIEAEDDEFGAFLKARVFVEHRKKKAAA